MAVVAEYLALSAGSTVNLKEVTVAETQLLNENYIIYISIATLNSMNIIRLYAFCILHWPPKTCQSKHF